MEDWQFLLDFLANQILWDDGDYENADDFVDKDPRARAALKEMMGIDQDYFTAVAPDPTDTELAAIRKQLRKLCRRRKPKRGK